MVTLPIPHLACARRRPWLAAACFLLLFHGLAVETSGAQPEPEQLRALGRLARQEFEYFSWMPGIFAQVGSVYDNRPEASRLEIAALSERAKANPNDASVRLRLGWLLNRYGDAAAAQQALDEGARVCRQRLTAKPDDADLCVLLALLRAGTREGEAAARRAVEVAPQSWRAYDALARHQWRLIEQRILGNMATTPFELAMCDPQTLVSALKAHAADSELETALLRLEEERAVTAREAIKAAPPTQLDPLLHAIGARIATAGLLRELGRLRAEKAPAVDAAAADKAALAAFKEADAVDNELLGQIDHAVNIAGFDTEALAVLGFLQANIRLEMHYRDHERRTPVVRRPKGPPPVRPPLRPLLFQDRLISALPRLRELAGAKAKPSPSEPEPDAESAAVAAKAAEGYGALISFISLAMGQAAKAPETPELPALLEVAVKREPSRPLLWDALLATRFSGRYPGPFAVDARTLALQRLENLQTARSHAMVAYCSPFGQAPLEWAKAMDLERNDIELHLNLAAATLAAKQTPESLQIVGELIDEARRLDVSDLSWQRRRLELFRLRLEMLTLAMRGEKDKIDRLVRYHFGDEQPDKTTEDLQVDIQKVK